MRLGTTIDKSNIFKATTCVIIGTTIGIAVLIDYKILIIALFVFLTFTAIVFLKTKFELFVLINIFLLSFVLTEPAPSDLIFIFLFIFFILNKVQDFEKIGAQYFPIVLLCMFIITNTITALNAIDYFASIKYLSITLYLFIFCMFIFLYSSPQNYLSLLRAYVLSSLTSAILAFMGYAGYFQSLLMMDEFRVKALFKDPNVFGPFLIPAVIILIDDLRQKRIVKANSLVHIAMISIIIGGIIISFSRAAWINLIASLIAYLILNIKKINIFKTTIYLCLFFFIIFFSWNYAINKNIKNFIFERAKIQNYDKERFTSQTTGIQLAKNNLVGYGPGQHEIVVARAIGEIISAHSLYVRVFIENGVIGAVLLITSLICICFNLLIVHLKENNTTLLRCSVLLSILFGLMINSLVIDTLHWRHFWFFIGLSLSAITNTSNTHNNNMHYKRCLNEYKNY